MCLYLGGVPVSVGIFEVCVYADGGVSMGCV